MKRLVFLLAVVMPSIAFAHLAHLERYLALADRMEGENENFERGLDEMMASQKKSPNRVFDPLAQIAYQRLRGLNALMEDERKIIVEGIEGLAQQTKKASSRRQLFEIQNWLLSRSEAEKFLLLAIVREFPMGVRTALDPAFGTLLRADPLTREGKRYALRAEFKKRTAAALKIRDREADSDFKNWAVSNHSTRRPFKIEPSVGPQGNVEGTELRAGTIVWTFDDGPHPTFTERLLGILKEYRDPLNQDAPATFFRVVDMVQRFPTVVEAQRRAGYPMNSHSWTHANFSKISKSGNTRALYHETVEATPVLAKAFGYRFRFFRCPGGACITPRIPIVRKMIADQGLIHAYWSIDSLDWSLKDQPQRTANNIIKSIQLSGKGVILVHDIHDWSIEAVRMSLSWIKKVNTDHQGVQFRLLTLEDAVDEINLDSAH